MMVQLCLDQSRDVNHVCVCADVMWCMVLIIINLKRVRSLSYICRHRDMLMSSLRELLLLSLGSAE